MLLTSYNRLLRYLAGSQSENLENNFENRRDLVRWIAPTSSKVERYLKRILQTTTHEEYFDNDNNCNFFVKSPVITSITSVKYDSTGQFTGSELTLLTTDYKIDVSGHAVVIPWGKIPNGYKTLQITYVGGMAQDGVLSTYETGDASSMTIGNFVIGSDSMATGIIKAVSADSLEVEVLFGLFVVGETLTEYTGEDATGATSEAVTLISKTIECLAELYPEIVTACEMEIRYLYTHKRDYENISTDKEGVTRRRDGTEKIASYGLQPEVIDMLREHRLMVL